MLLAAWLFLPVAGVTLGGLLACSLWLNRKLYASLKHYYVLYNAVQLDPLGLELYPAADPGSGPVGRSRRRVLIYGDSRAVEWPAPAASPCEFQD